MKTFESFAAGLALILLITAGSAAQDAKQDEARDLVLEVIAAGDRPPSSIQLRRDRPAGFWTSGFPRSKPWRPSSPDDRHPVLNFEARVMEDTAELEISIFSGKRFREIVDVIGRYKIREGETVAVSEVVRFGYEPLSVRLVRSPLSVGQLPVADNRTRSIRVSISPVVSAIPQFRFELANDSSKPIAAVIIRTEVSGRKLSSGMPHGVHGAALIMPGQTFGQNLKNITPPGVAGQTNLVIAAAIFTDNSVDGDLDAGAQFLAAVAGRKRALMELIPMLDAVASRASNGVDWAGLAVAVRATKAPYREDASREKSAFNGVVIELSDAILKLSTRVPAGEQLSTFSDLLKLYKEWLNRLPD
ncbi:MAG: hypothetical protein WKF34_11135 [Pyrinomonadaceae bacterium]